ncbi:YciI family protein [Caulobacter sp. 1776]|uniref:YciI family protein n=1 Tax=Caulobacter sp. 1776 TaxID=3156420 RepID=UPI003393E57C
MQYALLIYENETLYRGDNGRALDEIVAAHRALAGELAGQGILKGGAGLNTTDTATTVRKTGGEHALHDGPYAEAREQLGGFYLVDVPDLDAALAIAKRIPLTGDGSIEVRPLTEGA